MVSAALIFIAVGFVVMFIGIGFAPAADSQGRADLMLLLGGGAASVGALLAFMAAIAYLIKIMRDS